MKEATIVGAGLVGSLWAVYLSKAGYKVKIFERRPDLRKAEISAGKSINLATSYRGWKALDKLEIGYEIRKIAIPMYGRTIHNIDEKTSFQPYGLDKQAIFSVSRASLNCKLIDIAERTGNTHFYFNEQCYNVDLDKNIAFFENSISKVKTEYKTDVIFATDGAFSAVRYSAMQKLDKFNFSQNFIEDGYREILLPANVDGSYKLERDTLHIWPRGRFMLIALPNFDGSFTCTLFMPFEGHHYCFNNLTSTEKVESFFKEMFPDFFKLMPHVAETWEEHPLSSLAIIRCYPWIYNKTALMGDAAHATVPFFGQGMNSGFEDCTVMWDLMQKHNEDWTKVFEEYQHVRKPNGDAVQDLSLQNYLVMRDKVNDEEFITQQKFEKRISQLYPNQYLPLYSMVSFSEIEYKTALELGSKQDAMIKDIIKKYNITNQSNSEEIDEIIHSIFANQIK